jgi:hypothetical protein
MSLMLGFLIYSPKNTYRESFLQTAVLTLWWDSGGMGLLSKSLALMLVNACGFDTWCLYENALCVTAILLWLDSQRISLGILFSWAPSSLHRCRHFQ